MALAAPPPPVVFALVEAAVLVYCFGTRPVVAAHLDSVLVLAAKLWVSMKQPRRGIRHVWEEGRTPPGL